MLKNLNISRSSQLCIALFLYLFSCSTVVHELNVKNNNGYFWKRYSKDLKEKQVLPKVVVDSLISMDAKYNLGINLTPSWKDNFLNYPNKESFSKMLYKSILQSLIYDSALRYLESEKKYYVLHIQAVEDKENRFVDLKDGSFYFFVWNSIRVDSAIAHKISVIRFKENIWEIADVPVYETIGPFGPINEYCKEDLDKSRFGLFVTKNEVYDYYLSGIISCSVSTFKKEMHSKDLKFKLLENFL
ncbi:hypothetical protein [Leptospira stimsonii]|uniref:Uncharacterized protein n=1 Tax=Leptospira stimsonii TaxID=2202203 RepID=A0A8B3CMS4_9LEPT|nr:hypothetical protein [Leptospira stimsonii]RHX83364.1 hypothetical protein DLM78_21945 [Leptospira stimsonii]